ncbi:MAG TPA: ergothioneine biosynthesis protein EgtB [Vicinamibacteria bacterium]|nr:ergothioneine biosynthesis protein EgtB [Vicinamibacteria bacterium]
MASHRAEVASARAHRLRERYADVRAATAGLSAPLSPEDQLVQSMPDASPTKWHLAHTTWFFEAFVLSRFVPGYRVVDEKYAYLFNSYYEAVGPRQPRPRRGAMTRPSLDEVRAYREAINERMDGLFDQLRDDVDAVDRIELGLHHEQQHQELILTDIHHALWSNPLRPAYRPEARSAASAARAPALEWTSHAGGLVEIGHAGSGFSFDNERPRHRVFLEPFQMGRRAVTAGEYLRFIEDGGYRRPDLWLSDGWTAVQEHGWTAPLYWEHGPEGWSEFTLAGTQPLRLDAPVSHVSYYEAEAFARWAGARLPTEAEWEVLAAASPIEGHFVESATFAPAPAGAAAEDRPAQMFGDVWEWTASAYLPYPRFRPLEGELGEYNGKFMSGQMVLRGGSCFTPRSHIRPTYRNFFPPAARWQMSGLRLARWA